MVELSNTRLSAGDGLIVVISEGLHGRSEAKGYSLAAGHRFALQSSEHDGQGIPRSSGTTTPP